MTSVATGGLSQLSKVGTASRVVSKGVLAYDVAGNAVSAGRGAVDAYNNGLGFGNTVQIIGGGLGVGGNFATGGQALRELASDASRLRVEPTRFYSGVPIPNLTVGSYAEVGGHHIHAKRAFDGVTGYDPKSAFAISADTLSNYGVRHSDITTAQQRLFREFAESGLPNTLTHHSRIAYQSMVEAGIPRNASKELVIQSQQGLIRKGVVEPNAIPWGKR